MAFLEDKVFYKGTRAQFDTLLVSNGADYEDKLVFIQGGATPNMPYSCIWAQGMYFADIAELIKAIAYVKGVNIGGSNYTTAVGGGYIAMKGVDSQTEVSVDNGTVQIGLSTTFVTRVTTAEGTLTRLASRLDSIEEDYLTSADKIALSNLIDGLTNKVGNVTDLDNYSSGSVDTIVEAINDALTKIEAGGSGSVVTMSGDASTGYTLKQGDTTIGTISIPKDMVVSKGEVVVNPASQAAGTYIVLTLANATNDKIYINVGTLVDIYKAEANATQVQIAIDSTTREISATIVTGGVATSHLAAKAVTSEKINDGAVKKAHLNTEVLTAINTKVSEVVLVKNGITGEFVKHQIDAETEVGQIKVTFGKMGDASTAVVDGIATTADVRAYVDSRLSWKTITA